MEKWALHPLWKVDSQGRLGEGCMTGQDVILKYVAVGKIREEEGGIVDRARDRVVKNRVEMWSQYLSSPRLKYFSKPLTLVWSLSYVFLVYLSVPLLFLLTLELKICYCREVYWQK